MPSPTLRAFQRAPSEAARHRQHTVTAIGLALAAATMLAAVGIVRTSLPYTIGSGRTEVNVGQFAPALESGAARRYGI
jgi:hypothetical protein